MNNSTLPFLTLGNYTYSFILDELKNFLLKEQNKEGFVFAEDVYGRELEKVFNNQLTE